MFSTRASHTESQCEVCLPHRVTVQSVPPTQSHSAKCSSYRVTVKSVPLTHRHSAKCASHTEAQCKVYPPHRGTGQSVHCTVSPPSVWEAQCKVCLQAAVCLPHRVTVQSVPPTQSHSAKCASHRVTVKSVPPTQRHRAKCASRLHCASHTEAQCKVCLPHTVTV